jgi:hypothetical protein
MTFKFVAKNLQTGLTGSVTVRADREVIARERLQRSGYEIIRLARVTNDQVANQIKLVGAVTAAPRARRMPQPSARLRMKLKVSALLHNVFAPFALFS